MAESWLEAKLSLGVGVEGGGLPAQGHKLSPLRRAATLSCLWKSALGGAGVVLAIHLPWDFSWVPAGRQPQLLRVAGIWPR